MPTDTIESRLRETLGAVAAQTDVGTPTSASDHVEVVDLDVPRRRHMGWWLGAAATVAVLALATVAVTRADREASVQSTSAPTTTTTAPPTPVNLGPLRLIATYLPPGFRAQPMAQIGSGQAGPAVRYARYLGDSTAAGFELTYFFLPTDDLTAIPEPYRPKPLNPGGQPTSIQAQVNGTTASVMLARRGPAMSWLTASGQRAVAVLLYRAFDPTHISGSDTEDVAALQALATAAKAVVPGSPPSTAPVVKADALPSGFRFVQARPSVDALFGGSNEADFPGWRQIFEAPDNVRITLQTIDRPYSNDEFGDPVPGRKWFDTPAGLHFVAADWDDPTSRATWAVLYGGNDQFMIRLEGQTTQDELIKIANGLRLDMSAPPATVAPTTTR